MSIDDSGLLADGASNSMEESIRDMLPVGYWFHLSRFARGTQREPGSVAEIDERYNRHPNFAMHIAFLREMHPEIENPLRSSVEAFGSYVLRGNGLFSIVANDDLPTVEIPSGGILDLSFYDYLKNTGNSIGVASKCQRTVVVGGPEYVFNVLSTAGNGKGFVTVGGVWAFAEKNPVLTAVSGVGIFTARLVTDMRDDPEVQEDVRKYEANHEA